MTDIAKRLNRKRENQTDTVLRHMMERGEITSLQAFRKYNITRLAAVIHIIKTAGIPVESEMRESDNGKRYKAYWLPLKGRRIAKFVRSQNDKYFLEAIRFYGPSRDARPPV